MSKNKTAVPDAWDDDWESQADVGHSLSQSLDRYKSLIMVQKVDDEPAVPEPEIKLSKAERRAQHDAANRRLWEDAYANIFLEMTFYLFLEGMRSRSSRSFSRLKMSRHTNPSSNQP